MNNGLPKIYKSPNGKKFIIQPYEFPSFKTKHSAYECINFLRLECILKRCGQIEIREEWRRSASENYFTVICREKSFESELVKESFHTLWKFYGCPPNCHYYTSLLRMKIIDQLSSLLSKHLNSVFIKFRFLPWQTQVAIILGIFFVIISLLAPQWLNSLIKLTEVIRH